jgi:hypothetical protein
MTESGSFGLEQATKGIGFGDCFLSCFNQLSLDPFGKLRNSFGRVVILEK